MIGLIKRQDAIDMLTKKRDDAAEYVKEPRLVPEFILDGLLKLPSADAVSMEEYLSMAETVKKLHQVCDKLTESFGGDVPDAIKSAIRAIMHESYEEGYADGQAEAIEQEPEGDLISRADVIETLKRMPGIGYKAIHKIEELPTADRPNGRG